MSNYIYINRKRTKLNLDTFNRNVIDTLVFLAAFVGTFVLAYLGFLIAFAKGWH